MRVQITFAAVMGRAIRLAREDQNLSNAKLARRLEERLGGNKAPSLSAWEAGQNLPDTPNMEAILVALDVDGPEFVTRFLVQAAKELRREARGVELVPGAGVALVKSDAGPKRKRGRPPKAKPAEDTTVAAPPPHAKPRA